MEQIDKNDLRMINGLCCCYDLLYCVFPDCYGCARFVPYNIYNYTLII